MPQEELIQRSIIHRSQDLGCSRQTLRSLHHQLPFLLLTGAQMVAENLPLHVELAGRFALLQLHTLVIELPVLYYTEGNSDAFPVSFLVGILQADEGIVQLQDAMLDASFLIIYIHQDIGIAERGAVVEHGGMRGIEPGILLVNELLPEGGQTAVVLGEEHKVEGIQVLLLPFVSLDGLFQPIGSRRQGLPGIQRHPFARSEGTLQSRLLGRLSPLNRIETIRARHFQQLPVGIRHTEGGGQRILFAQEGGQIRREIVRSFGSRESTGLALRLAVAARHGSGKGEIGHRTEVILFSLRQECHGNRKTSLGIQAHGVGHQRTGLPAPDAVTPRQGISQGYFLNGRTVVGRDLSGQRHGVAQGVGRLYGVESDFKRRTFVLLHPYRGSGQVARLDDEIAVQATGGQDKFCGKGAEIVGAHLLLGNFLAVDVQQGKRIGPVLQHTGDLLVLLISNAFDVDGLAGPVKRAVGQQGQVRLWLGIALAIRGITDVL